uniref:Uncharacterized protein n=1 Tax=Clytia hemisphaerica TaxID=252671 RepID=A0A7M5VBH8_9CNID
QNICDSFLEDIDFDEDISPEEENWSKEDEVIIEEEEIEEDWENFHEAPVPKVVKVVFVNEQEVEQILKVVEEAPPDKKNPRKNESKKFSCQNCEKKYAIEYHFKKHEDICKTKKKDKQEKGHGLDAKLFEINVYLSVKEAIKSALEDPFFPDAVKNQAKILKTMEKDLKSYSDTISDKYFEMSN